MPPFALFSRFPTTMNSNIGFHLSWKPKALNLIPQSKPDLLPGTAVPQGWQSLLLLRGGHSNQPRCSISTHYKNIIIQVTGNSKTACNQPRSSLNQNRGAKNRRGCKGLKICIQGIEDTNVSDKRLTFYSYNQSMKGMRSYEELWKAFQQNPRKNCT